MTVYHLRILPETLDGAMQPQRSTLIITIMDGITGHGVMDGPIQPGASAGAGTGVAIGAGPDMAGAEAGTVQVGAGEAGTVQVGAGEVTLTTARDTVTDTPILMVEEEIITWPSTDVQPVVCLVEMARVQPLPEDPH